MRRFITILLLASFLVGCVMPSVRGPELQETQVSTITTVSTAWEMGLSNVGEVTTVKEYGDNGQMGNAIITTAVEGIDEIALDDFEQDTARFVILGLGGTNQGKLAILPLVVKATFDSSGNTVWRVWAGFARDGEGKLAPANNGWVDQWLELEPVQELDGITFLGMKDDAGGVIPLYEFTYDAKVKFTSPFAEGGSVDLPPLRQYYQQESAGIRALMTLANLPVLPEELGQELAEGWALNQVKKGVYTVSDDQGIVRWVARGETRDWEKALIVSENEVRVWNQRKQVFETFPADNGVRVENGKLLQVDEAGQWLEIPWTTQYSIETPEWVTETPLKLIREISTGRVKFVEYEGQVHPAEYLEVPGLPPVLLVTSRQFVEDEFRGIEGYFAFKDEKRDEGTQSIINAYINTLATIRLKNMGNRNPAYETIVSEAEKIKTTLASGQELQGIGYTDPLRKYHQLTGKPLLFLLTPFNTKVDGWPAVDGGYTYHFMFKNDVDILHMSLTKPYAQHTYEYNNLVNVEAVYQAYVNDVFEYCMISAFRYLSGIDFLEHDILTQSWYQSGLARSVGDSINPYYTEHLMGLDQEKAVFVTYGWTQTGVPSPEVYALMLKHAKDKDNPISSVYRTLKKIESSFFEIFSITIPEFSE